jgi:hypothetical protein
MASRLGRLLVATVAAALFADPVLAHAGSLGATGGPVETPLWLFLLTGGGVVAGSFLFTTFVTDREFITAIHEGGRSLPSSALALAGDLAGALSVVALAGVLASGLFGTTVPSANAAVLVVWVGWWAGYTMTTYLVGNSWPAINPWRRMAAAVEGGVPDREYPASWGAWPSVVVLLGMVYLEIVSPFTEAPRLLAVAVLVYTVVTVLGAASVGVRDWFERVDPIARVFRYYGRVAPVQRTENGVEVTLPGARLLQSRLVTGFDEVAFVLALLWSTTYDGLVTTPAWGDLADAVVGVGVPAPVLYLAGMVLGYAVFVAAYRLAARLVRGTADSYVTVAAIETRFAPTLLPIAAGYHVAHFLGYFFSLSPQLVAVFADPFSTVVPAPLTLPGWFGALPLLFVLAGHVLAVWLAHATAFELFTGRLQPIRSQYPFVVVMVFYTMTSLWVITQPFVQPPYL